MTRANVKGRAKQTSYLLLPRLSLKTRESSSPANGPHLISFQHDKFRRLDETRNADMGG